MPVVHNPTAVDFKKALKMRQAGATSKDIYRALGRSPQWWRAHKKLFFEYFVKHSTNLTIVRDKVVDSTKSIYGKRGRPGVTTMTPADRRYIIQLSGLGAEHDVICRIIGIHPNTLKNWLDGDPIFKTEYEAAKERTNYNVLNALVQRATGMDSETVNEHQESRDTDKGYSNVTSKTVTRSRLAPNVGAIRLYLVNRMGWGSDVGGGGAGGANTDNEQTEYDIREGLYTDDTNGETQPSEA